MKPSNWSLGANSETDPGGGKGGRSCASLFWLLSLDVPCGNPAGPDGQHAAPVLRHGRRRLATALSVPVAL